MPLPTPRKNEKEKDFISRCMSEIQDEFKDQKQRLAVCYGQWKDKQKQMKKFDFDLKIKESKLVSRNSKKRGKTEKRVVVGYATTYDVFTNGDTLQITRQAVEEAKDDLLKYNTVLFNHDVNKPIGYIEETAADDTGLLVKIVLSNSEDEIWSKVQDGTISKLSFQAEIPQGGYNIIETEDKLIFQVIKIRFFEAGLVSIPGNGDAETITSYVTNSIEEYKQSKAKAELSDVNMDKNIISTLESIKEQVVSEDAKARIDELIEQLKAPSKVVSDLQILSGKLAEEDRKVVESAIEILKCMIKPKQEEKVEEVETVDDYNLSDESDTRPVFQLNLSDGKTELEEGSTNRFRKQILKFGKWFHWNAAGGVLNIDENTIDNIVKNFNKKVIENVSVPLTHTDDPSKNTGEVVSLVKTDTGLDAVIEIKDESIAEKIKKGLIKCVSASIDPNYRVKKTNRFAGTTLLHTALVSEPYIKGMGKFIPLTDTSFSDRPIVCLEDEEPTIQNVLKSMQELVTTVKNDLVTKEELTNILKQMKIKEDKEVVEPTKVETEKEVVVEEKKDTVVEDKKEEVVEPKANEEDSLEVKEAKAKDGFKTCVADKMKDGMSMADATKECKAKIKETFGIEFSDEPSEDINIESEEDTEDDIEQEVDLADAEKVYGEYLSQGKIVPAQKEAFIKLFTTGQTIKLSDKNTVGVTDLIKSFLETQPKLVNFSEDGTPGIPTPKPTPVAPDTNAVPDDVKDIYGKMGLSDDQARDAWKYAKEIAENEKKEKESTLF